MGIHNIDGGDTTEYKETTANKEKDIEDFLEKHPKVLKTDIIIIGRQIQTKDKGIIDLMGIDRKGDIIIIEIKKGLAPRDTVSQILEYAVWTKYRSYDELNNIAKKHHLGAHQDLYKRFESEFKNAPDGFNQSQELYIVAKEFDDKTKDMCKYLDTNGIKVRCVEIKFYENNGKQLVNTNVVVGNIEDDEDDVDDVGGMISTWQDRLDTAEDSNRKTVMELIETITKNTECSGHAQNRWYKLSIGTGMSKTAFAFIIMNKKTATLAFRCEPEDFDIDDESIREVKRWFFKSERRIRIVPENHDIILECVKHAMDASKKCNSMAANRAVKTRGKQT